MSRRTSTFLALVLGLAGVGCNFFDPSLYRDLDAGDDGGAGPVLAETCRGDMPTFTETVEGVFVDLAGYADDVREVAACTGVDTPGHDAFFAVPMTAGDKWHFHVRAQAEADNPAIYVLRSCDERTCQPGDAVDVCGEGRDEHMSFRADRTQTYFVGIDSRTPGGTLYEVLAIHPICGNGTLEHSESCDDGGTDPGDGCDEQCRAEVSPTATGEVEPNDDYTAANTLVMGGDGTVSVQGQLGGKCDFDLFVVTVPEGGGVEVEMLAPGGTPCTAVPVFTMELLDADATRVLGTGAAVSGGNECPAIGADATFAHGLAAGEYVIRVNTDENNARMDYRLDVRVTAP